MSEHRAIRVLDDAVINKIAAGEVVERPASVVKELIENALDADARKITVEIQGHGQELIRVMDDGWGMTPEEARMCLQRHATSKITAIDDVWRLHSYGFRGEALPSIAAVSHLELLTMVRHHTGPAVRVILAAGQHVRTEETASTPGTSITVKRLFYNTPARLKFLKAPQTEMNHILQTVTNMALTYPDRFFEVRIDGKPSLELSPAASLRERIVQIFGNDLAANLLEVRKEGPLEAGLLRIHGYISAPSLNRSSRKEQYFFVNRRPIESKTLSAALSQGYRTLMMTGRFPVAFLFLESDPASVDVNVHPAKREVRFKNDRSVFSEVTTALQEALTGTRAAGQIHPSVLGNAFRAGSEPVPFQSFSGSGSRVTSDPSTLSHAIRDTRDNIKAGEPIPVYRESADPETRTLPPFLNILGQFHATFILAENDEGLWIIDQHAAHERVLLENLQKTFAQGKLSSQNLLLPVVADLSPAQMEIYKGNQELLSRTGFDTSTMSGRSVHLDAVPSLLTEREVKRIFIDLLDHILEKPGVKATDSFTERLLYYMACRGAVMAGDKMTPLQMASLLEALTRCKYPFSCSHGRPTMIKVSVQEMEKLFKRA